MNELILLYKQDFECNFKKFLISMRPLLYTEQGATRDHQAL